MQRTLFALIAILPALVAGQARINTPPSVVECQPAQIAWEGGEAPYYLTILPGGETGGSPIEQFPETRDTSMSWTVDIAAGSSITFQIRDATGSVNFSDQVSVQEGTDSGCVSASASGGGSSASSTASSSGSSSGSSSSPSATSGSTSSSSGSTSGNTSSGSTSGSSGSSNSDSSSNAAESDSADSSSSNEDSGAMKFGPTTVGGVLAAAAAIFVGA